MIESIAPEARERKRGRGVRATGVAGGASSGRGRFLDGHRSRLRMSSFDARPRRRSARFVVRGLSPLALVLGVVAFAACSGAGPEELPEPWATCREVGDRDEPAPLPSSPDGSPALLASVRQAFELADDTPDEVVTAWTLWRCADGETLACVVGANLPCGEQADASRTPSDPMREYCRGASDGDIPAVVTGRTTVFTWRCLAGEPEAGEAWSEPDSRGFHRALWRRIEPPAGESSG